MLPWRGGQLLFLLCSCITLYGQFFFLLFDPELVTAGRNLMDGRYGTFGYGPMHEAIRHVRVPCPPAHVRRGWHAAEGANLYRCTR